MVKKNQITKKDLLLCLFKYNTFKKKVNLRLLIIYNVIMLILLSLVGVLLNNVPNYTLNSNVSVFFSVLITIPIILLILYGLFYIFLNSYEVKRKRFFESFFVFLTILLPFMLVSNILGLIITYYLYINYLVYILVILIFILTIYFIITYIMTLKKYFNVEGFKIVSSSLFVLILVISFLLLQYLSYLVTMLN